MIEKTDLRGRVVFAGVGNILRSDDGFGPRLAEEIRGRVSFRVIDAGMAPENYLGVIVREDPDTVIFADTAHFGGHPGEIRFMRASDCSDPSFFLTHNTSLKLLFQFMEARGTRADVFILCVQPASTDFAEEPGEEVKEAVEKLAHWFASNFPVGPDTEPRPGARR